LVVGVASFLLQLSLGRWALEKLGLAVNIAVLPGIIVLGGAFGLAVPGLLSASMLRGAEAVQRNTLFRSAYELLYTPLAEQQKRQTKAMIDIGFDRFGTVVGSGIALFALHLFAEHHASVMLGAVIALALATLPLTGQLHQGYVRALEQGLRDGAKKLGQTPKLASGRNRIPSGVPAREALIDRLEDLQPGGLSALLDADPNAEAAAVGPHRPASEASNTGASLEAARAILSADPATVRRALDDLRPRDAAVACAIGLLSHRELHGSAREALAKLAPAITGQLIDALLDANTDFAVRRRIPRILCACPTQRAADGLILGLMDERFEVRYACGRALLALTEENPVFQLSQDQAVAAIQCEIELDARILDELRPAGEDESASEDESPPSIDEQGASGDEEVLAGLKRDRLNRSLEHVFNILSLNLEREPLRIAYRALHHQDTKYRGTALEYLSTVLPTELRDLVWPYLGESAPLPTARTPHELLADLSNAVVS